MKKQVEQLKRFHKAFNLPLRNSPNVIPIKEFSLRYKLLMEEIEELVTAYAQNNIIEITDAVIDCMYILIGTAVQFGIADKLEQCFDEIHESNMSKLDKNGKAIIRKDGKVLKSDLYFPPNLNKILNEKNKAN